MPKDQIPLSDDDAEISARVAAHLRWRIHFLGISQNKMERMLKLSSGYLNPILLGVRGKSPSAAFVRRISQQLGIPLSRILNEEPPRSFRVVGSENVNARLERPSDASVRPPEIEESPNPSAASPSAQPGRRNAGGGKSSA